MPKKSPPIKSQPRRPGRPTSDSAATPLRETMLEEAALLFSEKNFDAVSIREIADRAGATLSALYHYFGNKRNLYLEAHSWQFQKSSDRLESIFEQNKDPKESLKYFTTELFDIFHEKVPFFNMLSRHLIDKNSDIREMLTKEHFSIQVHYVIAAIKKISPNRDEVQLAYQLYAMIFGMVALQPIYDSVAEFSIISRNVDQSTKLVLSSLMPEIDWS